MAVMVMLNSDSSQVPKETCIFILSHEGAYYRLVKVRPLEGFDESIL